MGRLLLLTLMLNCTAYGYKIVVINPVFAISHMKFLAAVADTLAEAGHDVTVLESVIYPANDNKTVYRHVKKIVKVAPAEELLRYAKAGLGGIWLRSSLPWKEFENAAEMSESFRIQCEKTITNSKLMNELRKEEFDVGIYEDFDICGAGILNEIGIKHKLLAQSCSINQNLALAIGQPITPSYIPGQTSKSGEIMSLFVRLSNIYEIAVGMRSRKIMQSGVLELFKRSFGSKYQDYEELVSESAFVFVNTNEVLDFPKPIAPKVISIGGITINPKANELDEEWNNILNRRKRNVFISFGTIALSKDMPYQYRDSMLKVFESLPDITFIWKYELENPTFADHLPNVKLTTWAPQAALISDSRLSLFITHGGLGSTTEIAYLGVPALIIPIFGDQTRNAEMMVRQGVALRYDKNDLSDSNKLREAIEKIIDDSTYRENATRLSQMLHDQPIDVKQKLIRHVQFAVKYGSLGTLLPQSRNLSYIQYYCVDIVLVVLVVIFLAFFVPYQIVRFAVKKVLHRKSKTE